MVLKIKRRCMVRIVSFSLVTVLVATGTFLKMNNRFNYIERQLVHKYQASLEELSASVDSMAMTLVKSLYAGTPAAFSSITNELVLQAGSAGAALSSLPVEQQGVEKISKFVSQVSDYSLALTKKMVEGEKITEQERKSLSSLASVAADLSVRLEEARTLYNDSQNWQSDIESALDGAESVSGLDTSFTEAEEALTDYPTLIYDGPFSDHILTKESSLLKSAEEISVEQAKIKAADFLKIGSDKLLETGSEDGQTPSYVFNFDGGSIAITKRGGYVTYCRKERDVSNSQMSYEQAVQKAADFLNSKGLGEFKSSYYFTDEGVCVVNFAYYENGVVYYTDLIKVGVALDTGEIVFYEARGYIMNHKTRNLSEPKNTPEQAKESVSEFLKINSVEKAVIPSGGENEILCYEFHCIGEQKEEILVYINADTLAEERLLILLKTDGGTLTK